MSPVAPRPSRTLEHKLMRPILLAALLVLSSCAVPPPDAYVATSATRRAREVSLGVNTAGEACAQAANLKDAAEIYCGTWEQPSARIRSAGPATPATLAQLASAGPWRASLDQRYICGTPRSGTALGNPAMLLDCTRRNGGWPQLALVALAGGQAWLADGVLPAAPAMERSIGILSGQASGIATLAAGGDTLLAQRLAARTFSAGDVAQYEALMVAGNRANLEGSPVAAEKAYRGALAVQEKRLARDDPGQANPLMHLALQVSNQDRFLEATTLLSRAETLARRSDDPMLKARLTHYQALHALNQQQPEGALSLLSRADREYSTILADNQVLIPADLEQRRAPGPRDRTAGAEPGNPLSSDGAGIEMQQLVNQNAMLGLVEVRRYKAEALRLLGRSQDSLAAFRNADAVARWAGVDQSVLVARLARTGAQTQLSVGDTSAAAQLNDRSARAVEAAFAGTPIGASSRLLQGADAFRAGDLPGAVTECRAGLRALTALRLGAPSAQAVACMDVLFADSARTSDPARRQADLADMFLTGQLAQGKITLTQLQVAAARLQEKNPGAADAIGRYQQAALQLARTSSAGNQPASRGPAPPVPEAAVSAARDAAAEAEQQLQAAVPQFNSVVEKPVTLAEVQKALRPDEALVAITLARDKGWSMLVRRNSIDVAPVAGGSTVVDPLVRRIREGMVQRAPMPAFDVEAARLLHASTLGGFDAALQGVGSLVVAPSGSLLSIPFGLLLTGPAEPADLGRAPWLIRRASITHVPSAVNFVALRGIAGQSRATKPWFGFGEFRHVTAAQARAAFPAECASDAAGIERLSSLPFARKELEEARDIFGTPGRSTLLGPAFTPEAVAAMDLKDYRILHFATHALLPSELACLKDAVIVASPPPGARSASAALLSADAISQLTLDADLVVLSACNTGGADGSKGGESLASLARSFFGAGARSLLVSNWEANDAAAYYLVTSTLRQIRDRPALGVAGAQRAVVLSVLEDAGKTLSQDFVHPFFWAPFAVIGEDGATGSGRATTAGLSGM